MFPCVTVEFAEFIKINSTRISQHYLPFFLSHLQSLVLEGAGPEFSAIFALCACLGYRLDHLTLQSVGDADLSGLVNLFSNHRVLQLCLSCPSQAYNADLILPKGATQPQFQLQGVYFPNVPSLSLTLWKFLRILHSNVYWLEVTIIHSFVLPTNTHIFSLFHTRCYLPSIYH